MRVVLCDRKPPFFVKISFGKTLQKPSVIKYNS